MPERFQLVNSNGDPLVSEEMLEKGYHDPNQEPPPVAHLPPNDGLWPVEHYQQFSAIYGWATREYNWTFDACMRDSTLNSEIMHDDFIINPALLSRWRPLCQLDWSLEPADSTNERLTKNAFKLTNILKRTKNLQQAKRTLMEAQFYGKSGFQWRPKWDYSTGERQLIIADWIPVHGDKIIPKYDRTNVGILVNTSAYRGATETTMRGACHFLTPAERELFVWHQFQPRDADFYHPDRAGAVHGYGFRGTLYWIWWLREKLTVILMEFLERVGLGMTIWYFEAGNPKSEAEVRKAIQSQPNKNNILFPRNKDGESAYAGPGVQRVEVSMQGANLFYNLFNLINEILEHAILGESATTRPTAGAGMNSDVGDQHGMTADERLKYDAVDLQDPMQDLVNVLNRYNCPGDPAPLFTFMVDKRNPVDFMNAVTFAVQNGIEVAESSIREELSLPTPEPGEPTIGKAQAMQPVVGASGMIPQGTPISTPGGPTAGVDQSGQLQQGGAQPSPDQGQVVQGQPVQQ